MRYFIVLTLACIANGAPKPQVDANRFVNGLLSQKFKGDAEMDAPTAAAALAYLNTVAGDDLCGKAAQAYVENIMKGENKEVAMSEAAGKYISAFNDGARPASGSGCQAAEVAWQEAFVAGEDPIPAAAKAYINSWPKSNDPCTATGSKYFEAINDGKSHLDAGNIAMGEFVKSLKNYARKGRSFEDLACTNAAKAYVETLNDKESPITAAFTAFVKSMFEENRSPYDPVCIKVMDGFTNSFNSGDDAETSQIKAAEAFFSEFGNGRSIPAHSPCTKAALAYAKASQSKDSSTSAAMFAYITETINSGIVKIDPVCAASTAAYMKAYKEKKNEDLASEAAAIAYLEALDKNPNFDPTSPCGKAAEAYIKTYSL